MKPEFLMTAQEVLAAQGSSHQGLAEQDAAQRLEKHGANRLQEAKKITNFQRFCSSSPILCC